MRFVLIENDPEFPNDGVTRFYWDTTRPAELDPILDPDHKQKYIAVECYIDRDPNNYVPVKDMQILFTDQAEYYFVCRTCFEEYQALQWTGNTTALGNWRHTAEIEKHRHEHTRGWCEFCDPIFGNGGWRLEDV